VSDTKDMTRQHEAWIADVLNFLNDAGAPIYRHDREGTKKGAPYDIPSRLRWTFEALRTARAETARVRAAADHAATKSQDRVDDLERSLRLAYGAMVPAEGENRPGEAIMLLDNAIDPGQHPDKCVVLRHKRDERGVTRVKIDARTAFVQVGLDGIVHDLDDDEIICPQCRGLGLCKASSSYGKGERKPREAAFPYHHEWLAPCPACYMGKIRVCQEPVGDKPEIRCLKPIPRMRTICDCKPAVAVAAAARAAKEEERRERLPRVKLADYEGEMLYCAGAQRFIMVDEIADHLEDGADEFFACNPAMVACAVNADQVMEWIEETASDEAGPEGDEEPVDFSTNAKRLLDAVLEAWHEHCVFPKTLHWANMNLIVEVSSE